VNRQEHHDKAEEQAEYATKLLERATDDGEDAGVSAMSGGGEHLIDLARGHAAVAQVHATLASIRDQ
jgi:cobalamin biosynthesis protein CbiG